MNLSSDERDQMERLRAKYAGQVKSKLKGAVKSARNDNRDLNDYAVLKQDVKESRIDQYAPLASIESQGKLYVPC
jgi:hypothetical protein